MGKRSSLLKSSCLILQALVLVLAKQIASVGGNPLDALTSGTFAPGDVNDPTGKGNTCDDANDPAGCIFTQKLLVEDASADEVSLARGFRPRQIGNSVPRLDQRRCRWSGGGGGGACGQQRGRQGCCGCQMRRNR